MEKQPNREGIIRIAVTGPESTGKSTLSAQLAEHFQTIWVPEYARSFLRETGGKYNEPDLLRIARKQQENESISEGHSNRILICDTEMIVIKIWSMVKYGRCHPEIAGRLSRQQYTHYLLCNIDIPWEEDPLREHPHFRNELFALYKQELKINGFPYTVISGNETQRFSKAVRTISALMNPDSSKNP